MNKRKLGFLEKECKTKQERFEELESLLDARSAHRNQASSTTTFLHDPCERNDSDKIGNLEYQKRAFFLCELENNPLKQLQKFDGPLQLNHIKYDHDVDILSRDYALCQMKHLKKIIQ